jgi:hypothetical protein
VTIQPKDINLARRLRRDRGAEKDGSSRER